MSETRKLYIADWHYAHANILAFDNRPFKTVEEMNEELVKRWNATVNPGDTVYVLGDMFWCISSQAVPILQALNGMMEHDKYLMQELYGKQCQMFNVGAMMPYMDYTPRTLDEILKGAS